MWLYIYLITSLALWDKAFQTTLSCRLLSVTAMFDLGLIIELFPAIDFKFPFLRFCFMYIESFFFFCFAVLTHRI